MSELGCMVLEFRAEELVVPVPCRSQDGPGYFTKSRAREDVLLAAVSPDTGKQAKGARWT